MPFFDVDGLKLFLTLTLRVKGENDFLNLFNNLADHQLRIFNKGKVNIVE